jgi:hypothetical protein
MVPNSLSSILANLNVARPQTLPFDKTGVNEIGRKSSFMSVIGFFLGSGYNVSILPGLQYMTVTIRRVQNLFDRKHVFLQNSINI